LFLKVFKTKTYRQGQTNNFRGEQKNQKTKKTGKKITEKTEP
jgi:hypothetical protein